MRPAASHPSGFTLLAPKASPETTLTRYLATVVPRPPPSRPCFQISALSRHRWPPPGGMGDRADFADPVRSARPGPQRIAGQHPRVDLIVSISAAPLSVVDYTAPTRAHLVPCINCPSLPRRLRRQLPESRDAPRGRFVVHRRTPSQMPRISWLVAMMEGLVARLKRNRRPVTVVATASSPPWFAASDLCDASHRPYVQASPCSCAGSTVYPASSSESLISFPFGCEQAKCDCLFR